MFVRALVLGGAAGNLIDRFTLGRVIDFLDFHFWPVFNIADSCLVCGAGLLILQTLFKPMPKEKPAEPAVTQATV